MPSSAWADKLEYRYDSMQRLTQAHYGDGTVVDFVYDNLGNRLMKTTTLLGGPSNQPPAAVISPGLANGVTNVPTTATLSWSPAVDPNPGDSVVYFIHFGTSPAPPLVFSGWTTNWSPGKLRGWTTYYWQIVARDSHNAQTASPVWNFTTGNEPPVADFVVSSATNGFAPLAVTFADRSFDNDNAIVSWQWDFDNNGTVDSTNRNPTFTYTTPGDYAVSLSVSDEAGDTNAVVKSNFIHVVGNNIVDLAPLGLTIESATSYRHLVVRYAITNQGTFSLSGKWQWADTFYVSTNAFLDAAAIQVATFYENQSLPPATVYTRTNAVTIPDIAAENYYLLLKADGQNQIGEISEGNNVWVVPMTNSLPDLVTVTFKAFGEAVAGQRIQVTYAVTNQGILPINAGWYDGFYMSTNSTWDVQDTRLGDVQIAAALRLGDGYLATNNVSLPTWPPGPYYLVARADANNWLVESNEANNAVAIPITLTAPDLAPVALQVPAVVTGAPNSNITVVWGVTNQSAGPAVGSWFDGVYLSTNAVLDWTDWLIVYRHETNTVPAESGYWRTNTVPVPEGPSGTYYLIFKADAYTYLYESDEGNNVLAVPVTYINLFPPPDLMPVALQSPAVVTGPPNPSVTLVWGVTNRGAGPAWGFWVDEVYLSTDAALDWYDEGIDYRDQTNTVAAGGSYWRTNTVPLPVEQSGTYYLIFAADNFDDLYESDEDNNVLAVPVMFNVTASNAVRIAGAQFLTNGRFQLAVLGAIGSSCALQASTNLINWTNILNFACTNSPTLVVDPATNYNRRFYRVVTQ